MFIVMTVYAILFICIGLTKNIQNQRIKKLRSYLVTKLIWNETLSFISESYMLFAISWITNFTFYEFKTFGQIFSGIFAQLGSLVLVLFPVLLFRFMYKKKIINARQGVQRIEKCHLLKFVILRRYCNHSGAIHQHDESPHLHSFPNLSARLQILLDLRLQLPCSIYDHLRWIVSTLHGRCSIYELIQ